MMQVYNRKNIDYMEKEQTPPASFSSKFDAFVEQSNALGVRFAEHMEQNTDLKPGDKIDQSICDEYTALFENYAPDGYTKEKVTLVQTTDDPNCNSTALWENYGELIQKQVELTQAGKFTSAEEADMMRMATEIGQYSTTDIGKACALYDELEALINSK